MQVIKIKSSLTYFLQFCQYCITWWYLDRDWTYSQENFQDFCCHGSWNLSKGRSPKQEQLYKQPSSLSETKWNTINEAVLLSTKKYWVWQPWWYFPIALVNKKKNQTNRNPYTCNFQLHVFSGQFFWMLHLLATLIWCASNYQITWKWYMYQNLSGEVQIFFFKKMQIEKLAYVQ